MAGDLREGDKGVCMDCDHEFTLSAASAASGGVLCDACLAAEDAWLQAR